MASSYEKPTAEQVRTQYRHQFFAAGLVGPTIVDKLDADGLIHSNKLGAPLKVEIPVWDDRPPAPSMVNVLILECLLSSSPEWVRIGTQEDIPWPGILPDTAFPLEREIPLDIFKDYEGKFQFRFRVKNWNGQDYRESPPAQVTIDKTGPIWTDPLRAMIEIVEKPVITDAVLARDGGVFCVIPDFIEDKKAEVTVHVGWLDRVPEEGEDITRFVVLKQLVPADRKVLVPASVVTALGSKAHYAVAILVDKAGNRGELSLPATVQVALGTLPSDLEPCEVPLAADDGLIDRADAAYPTKVHIKQYTGHDSNDGIIVWWGSRMIARTSVGAHLPFELKITVPWALMALEYDFNSPTHVQPVAVNYSILRGDYPFAPPSGISVDTDFAIPGPGNPEPELINPNLEQVVFESSSGSNTELTLADIGEPAEAKIKLFDNPAIGDTLTLYYHGVAVTSADNPYVVSGTEGPNEEIIITIPWDDIKRTPIMDDLLMYYSLTRTGFANPQESERTSINVLVEVVNLPEPEFPVADFPSGIANCNSLKLKGSEWGIFVHIPKSTYLKEGVDVALKWQTYEFNGITPVAGTDHEETVTVDGDEEANGIDWFVPYIKCLKPTYNPPTSGGMGIVEYSIVVRGTPVPSGPASVIVAVFEADGTGNDHCKIPRP